MICVAALRIHFSSELCWHVFATAKLQGLFFAFFKVKFMKIIGFILLFFYLGSLFPAQHEVAHSSWVYAESGQKQLGLAVTVGASERVADHQGDPDETALLPGAEECTSSQIDVDCALVQWILRPLIQNFFARAPPFVLL